MEQGMEFQQAPKENLQTWSRVIRLLGTALIGAAITLLLLAWAFV